MRRAAGDRLRPAGVPRVPGHGENALLPPAADDVALAAAMRAVATDAGLRARLRAGGRAVVPRFTWAASARRHREIYAAELRDTGRRAVSR